MEEPIFRRRGDMNEELRGMLPLNIALDSTREELLLLHKLYSPGQPTFQLIVSLCLPIMQQALDACKLLAWSSNNVENEAYYYAMEGKLVELAVLLIVARKQVFRPASFHRNDGAGIRGTMTILQCLQNKILSLVDEESKLMAKFEHGKVTQIQSKILVLRSSTLLLEVFGSAGDTIEEYLQLQQPVNVNRKQVEKDLALRLGEKGFILMDGDFVFSIRDCVNSSKSVGIPAEYLDHLSDKLYPFPGPLLPLLPQKNVRFPPRKEPPLDGHWWSDPSLPTCRPLKNMVKSIRTDQVSKSIYGSRYSTSVDTQVKKQTKPISREMLAKFALSIKRGIRTP